MTKWWCTLPKRRLRAIVMVTTAIITILYIWKWLILKVLITRKKFGNYVWHRMLTRLIIVTISHIHRYIESLCCTPETNIMWYVNFLLLKKNCQITTFSIYVYKPIWGTGCLHTMNNLRWPAARRAKTQPWYDSLQSADYITQITSVPQIPAELALSPLYRYGSWGSAILCNQSKNPIVCRCIARFKPITVLFQSLDFSHKNQVVALLTYSPLVLLTPKHQYP